jgi:hypothetical protein
VGVSAAMAVAPAAVGVGLLHGSPPPSCPVSFLLSLLLLFGNGYMLETYPEKSG